MIILWTVLQEMNIFSHLDMNPLSNPNNNYDRLAKLIKDCREQHLPTGIVKYDK